MKLLVILFIIKLVAQIDIFNFFCGFFVFCGFRARGFGVFCRVGNVSPVCGSTGACGFIFFVLCGFISVCVMYLFSWYVFKVFSETCFSMCFDKFIIYRQLSVIRQVYSLAAYQGKQATICKYTFVCFYLSFSFRVFSCF